MDTISPKYNRKHLFVRRSELHSRLSELKRLQKNLLANKETLNNRLEELYSKDDIDEWFQLYVTPIEDHINTTFVEFSAVQNIISWPRRPLT